MTTVNGGIQQRQIAQLRVNMSTAIASQLNALTALRQTRSAPRLRSPLTQIRRISQPPPPEAAAGVTLLCGTRSGINRGIGYTRSGQFLHDDFVAQSQAFGADRDPGSGRKTGDLMAALAAEAALDRSTVLVMVAG
jgi:hypothetical protein